MAQEKANGFCVPAGFLQTSLTSVCLRALAVDKLPLSRSGCAGGRNHNPGCPSPAVSEVAHMSSPPMCFSSSRLLPLRPTSKSIHFNLDNMSQGTSTAGSYEEEVPSIWVQGRHNSFLYRHTEVYVLQIYVSVSLLNLQLCQMGRNDFSHSVCCKMKLLCVRQEVDTRKSTKIFSSYGNTIWGGIPTHN